MKGKNESLRTGRNGRFNKEDNKATNNGKKRSTGRVRKREWKGGRYKMWVKRRDESFQILRRAE